MVINRVLQRAAHWNISP